MKDISEGDENLTQPGAVPLPIDADEANLFPTSPPNARPADDDGLPLLPPWVKDNPEDMPPLLDS